MDIDKVKGIIVTSLLLLFFLGGQETNATNTTLWEVMKELITTLCSVATLFVAILALDNWKSQARNNKLDDVVESLPSIEKSQRAFCHSLLAVEMYCDYEIPSWKEHAELYTERYRELLNQITDHKAKLQILRRYLDDSSHRSLNHRLSQFESEVNLANEGLTDRYPSIVQDKPEAGITIKGKFSLNSQKTSVEKLFKHYSKLLYSIK
ncbi:hypothetical protein [Photobacterium sanguinicancri]|uniref:hypothetical protein n=1 Tax=Photobacterium sanguinicancri TaxID=875932 RepID=UPI0026E327A7|nr:hypothetical protein [Photobacterium sanguinicancri]MDO6498763.1 hypothetical protein [Photobacterium sanguinicancri]